MKDGCRYAEREIRIERLVKQGHAGSLAVVGNGRGLQVCDRETEEEREADRPIENHRDSLTAVP